MLAIIIQNYTTEYLSHFSADRENIIVFQNVSVYHQRIGIAINYFVLQFLNQVLRIFQNFSTLG